MPHHTIMPMEALEEQPPVQETECLPCRYGFVSGVRDAQGRLVISRIISTDPAAYLDPKFAPGQLYTPPAPPQATG